MSVLNIYRASAGSGKTHLLTQNYLKLAFKYKDAFAKILAVTFTNKAAEEMKTRILEEINLLIEEPEKSGHFDELKNIKGINNISERALEVRDALLHNYSRFNVSTIDSFVQRVVRAFTFEINISSDYDIELDEMQVIADLIEMLYDKTETDKALLNRLIKYAKFRISEGKNWDFKSSLIEPVKEILKEEYNKIYPADIKGDEIRERYDKLYSEIIKIVKKFEDDVFNMSTQAENKFKSLNIFSLNDYPRKVQTIVNFLIVKLKNKDYEILKTIEDATYGLENWYNKTSSEKEKGDIQLIYSEISPILVDIVKYIGTNFEKYLSAKKVLEFYHSFGIFNDTAALLPEYRDEKNVLLISDTTRILKELIGNNDAPFIYEKTGNKINNILIDEFQDTSSSQWHNFKPLVQNSLGLGYNNLIVGDIKQSIYRWRGGDWNLLLRKVKQDIGENFTQDLSLDTNWRSQKNIIDFNNAFFYHAPKILQNEFNTLIELSKDETFIEEIKESGFDKILIDAYSDSYQKCPEIDSKIGGKVELQFISGKTSEYKEEIAEILPKRIDEMLKSGKYRAGDIAVLVRKNSQAKDVVEMIAGFKEQNPEHIPYDIISAESLLISNNKAIKIIISAVKYLSEKENSVSLANLVYEYQSLKNAEYQDFNKYFSSVKNNNFENLLPKELFELREQIIYLSAYELCENIVRIFKLDVYEDFIPYLTSFFDLVLNFSVKEKSDVLDFVEWWDTSGNSKTVNISESADAINIITIHKSKGLAFNVVIIPFTDWKITPEQNPLLWTKTISEPFNTFEYLPVKYAKDLLKTEFKRAYFQETLFAFIDALNMLYVAFTRPRNELIIMSPQKGKEISKVSDLLFEIISKPNEIQENKNFILLKSKFTDNIFLSDESHDYLTKKEIINENKLLYNTKVFHSENWRQRLNFRQEAEDFFIESLNYVEEKVNYGNIMHKVFSRIKNTNDLDNVLKEFNFEGLINNQEVSNLKEKINFIVTNSSAKGWFKEDLEVITERAIITETGELRIPDRVISDGNQISVIDFKFGVYNETHLVQVKEYVGLLKKIYDKPVKGFLYYADNDRILPVSEGLF